MTIWLLWRTPISASAKRLLNDQEKDPSTVAVRDFVEKYESTLAHRN